MAFEYHLLPIPTPYALNPFAGNHPTALLNYAVFVDVKISIAEELRLVKWEFWDSISGHQFLSLIQPSTAKSYKSGDVIRAGFHVDATKCCEGQIEPIFRLHWSTATTLGSINHPIPVLMPIPQCLFVIPSVKETKKLVRVGECFECQWTIWNLGPTAQNAAITISTSSSSFPSPSHSSASDSHHTTSPLIYMGPKHHEFFLEAGTCKLVRGHLIATIQGFIPFPNAMVHAVQPGETLTFESLKHADILVLLNK